MAENIGDAYLNVVPKMDKGSTREIEAGIGKADAKGIGKKLGTKLSMAAAAGIAAAGAIGVEIGKQALQAYAQFEQVQGGAQLVWGEAYDYIADKAKSAYSSVQMSATDYLTQVNGLATGLKTSMGGNAQAAAELADKVITAEADVVAALGISEEAAQNAFNGIMRGNFTMVDNLQLGITPTKEGYQQMIDKVNEWNAAQGEATDYQMGNYADMEAALVDYIEMQGLSGYAAEEATGTISGALATCKAAYTDWITSLADEDANIEETTNHLVDAAVNAAKLIIPRLGEIALNLIVSLATQIGEGMANVMQKGIDAITAKFAQWKEAGKNLISNFLNGIAAKGAEIATKAAQIIQKGVAAVKAKVGEWREAGRNLITGLIDGIGGSVGAVVNKIKSIAQNAIDTFKGWLGINSPSKVFEELGSFTMQGYAIGIEGEASNTAKAMKSGVAASVDGIGGGRAGSYTINMNVSADSSTTLESLIRQAELAANMKRVSYGY